MSWHAALLALAAVTGSDPLEEIIDRVNESEEDKKRRIEEFEAEIRASLDNGQRDLDANTRDRLIRLLDDPYWKDSASYRFRNHRLSPSEQVSKMAKAQAKRERKAAKRMVRR